MSLAVSAVPLHLAADSLSPPAGGALCRVVVIIPAGYCCPSLIMAWPACTSAIAHALVPQHLLPCKLVLSAADHSLACLCSLPLDILMQVVIDWGCQLSLTGVANNPHPGHCVPLPGLVHLIGGAVVQQGSAVSS